MTLTGGTDDETDDQPARPHPGSRIQNPPMGGSQADYVAWALAVPGVTRAWAAPEQGTGTITVRFLMDDLRADDDGWPTPPDVADQVHDHINLKHGQSPEGLQALAPIKLQFSWTSRSPFWCLSTTGGEGRDRGAN